MSETSINTRDQLLQKVIDKFTTPFHRMELIGLILCHFVHNDTLSEEDFNRLKQRRILCFLRHVLEPRTFAKLRKIIKPVQSQTEKEVLANRILKRLERYGVSHSMLKTDTTERQKQIADCLRTTVFQCGNRGATWNLRMSTAGKHSWMPSTQRVFGDIIKLCKHPITHRDVAFITPEWKTLILTAWQSVQHNDTNSLLATGCIACVGQKRKRFDVY